MQDRARQSLIDAHGRKIAALALIAAFVLWAHFGSGVPVFHSAVTIEPGWERFRSAYGIGYFGDDGQFVRAVQNGYNLVFHTYKYAPRFTRKTAADPANSPGRPVCLADAGAVSCARSAACSDFSGDVFSPASAPSRKRMARWTSAASMRRSRGTSK